MRGKILYDIASGQIGFHAGDKEVNGTVVTKGLKSELGYGDRDMADYRYMTRLAPEKMYIEEYAHKLWEAGYAESDQDARNMILDILQSTTSPAKATGELNRNYNGETKAEEYYGGMQEAADWEERMRFEKEAENDEIQRQIIEENDLSLLNEAEKAGVSQSEIDKVFTPTELIEIIEEKKYGNRRQTGNEGTDLEKAEISESERNPIEQAQGETENGNRPGENPDNPNGDRRGEQPARAEDNGHGLTEAREAGEKYVNKQRMSYDAETSRDLEVVNKRFNDELDNFKAGTHKGNLNLGKPLGILRAAGVKDGEMTIEPKTLKSHLEKHNLKEDDLKGLAEAIQNPFFVYEHGTENPNIVIVTEVTATDGRRIAISVRLNNKNRDLTINEIASVHGKDSTKELERLSESESFTPKWTSNNENVLNWLGLVPSNETASLTNPKHISLAKVIQEFENPKLPDGKLQNTGDAFIPVTEKEFNALIDVLKKTGLAKDVIADVNKMREALGKEGVKAFQEIAELSRVNVAWNKALDGVKNGTHKGILSLGKPLEILQAAGIKSGNIELAKEVLEKKLKQHNLTTGDLKNLAEAIQNPIMVYEWGTQTKSTVIVTELTTKDGRKITVALRAENKGRNLEVNEVASLHGKAAERFLSEMENAKEGGLSDALRYVEKEKALDWLGLSTLSTNQGLSDNSTAKVIKEFKNPKIEDDFLRMQAVPIVEDTTETQIKVNGNWYARSIINFGSTYKIGDFVPDLIGSVIIDKNKKQTPVNNQLIEDVKREFGITEDFNEAGYLLTDGTMLDFSESKDGGTPGIRTKDHREISGIGDNVDLVNFIAMGNIRLSPESGGFEITGNPTPQQISTLKDYIRNFGGNVIVDFSTPGEYSTEYSFEYSETNPNKVIADIKRYYDFGIKPTKKISLMATSKGEVYGFVTEDGTVYIDPNRLNANTPIHEFGHLFWPTMPKDLRREITGLLKQTPAWEKLSDNSAYSNLKTDDQKADEIFNTILGNRGEKSIPAEEIMGRDITLIARITNAVNKFWEWVKSVFGSKEAKINRMADMTLGELLGGKKINLENEGKNANFAENKTHGKESEARMGNGRTMGSGSLHEALGKLSEGNGVYQTLSESNRRGGTGTTKSGIREGWVKDKFLTHLEIIARQDGTWIDDISTIADVKRPLTPGFENEPYVSHDGKDVIKVNNFAFLNDNNTDYEHTRDFNYFVDRLTSHNELFPEVPYKITGFTENSRGEVSVVLRQPFIDKATLATQEKIDNYLTEIGFKKSDNLTNGMSGWTNGKYEITDAKPQNVLVDSKGNLHFIDTDINSVYEKSEPAVRFQTVPNNPAPSTEQLRAALNEKLDGATEKIIEAHFDRWHPVKAFLDTLRKSGTKIEDHNDYYLRADAVASMIKAHHDNFKKSRMKPLLKALADIEKKGFSLRDIENYAMLKFGTLERNPYMSQKDITAGKQPKDDYSGVKAIEDEIGKPAAQFIAEFEKQAGNTLIAEFWKTTKEATGYSLKTVYESGGMTKADYDRLKAQNYYVPLRGHDQKTAEDYYNYSPDMGTYFSSPMQKANGRVSRAESPFAFIDQMALSATKFAKWNDLNKTLYRLTGIDKTGLLSKSGAWYMKTGKDANGADIWEAQEPVWSDDFNTYQKNMEAFEKNMENLKARGLAEQHGAKFDIGGLFIKPKQKAHHRIPVFVNGKEQSVYINADPAVSRSINGTNIVKPKEIEEYKNKILQAAVRTDRFLGKSHRFIATNITSRSPEFLLRNIQRDFIHSSAILPVKEGAEYWAKFEANYWGEAGGALRRHLFGKSDLSKPQDRALVDFMMNGGETGYVHFLELQKRQKSIEKEIKKIKDGKSKNPLAYLHYVPDAIDTANKFGENISRFSVFLTSREMGRSIPRSISDAKEVTVNFNRTGSGAMYNSFLRNNYLFVNPALQAAFNFAKVTARNPKKAAVLATAFASLACLAPLTALLFGGKEGWDEYWNLPEWDRQNNFCIYNGKGFTKHSLPQEFRVFTAIGDNMLSAVLGKKNNVDAIGDSALGLLDLSPVNPIGLSTKDFRDFKGGSVVAKLAPDRFAPFVEIAVNSDFANNKIWNDFADKNDPGFKQAKVNRQGEYKSPEWLVEVSRGLNDITGGDEVRPGMLDFNPDKVNHLLRSYLGGMYTTGSQIAETASHAIDPEKEVKTRDIPLLRAVYTSKGDLRESNHALLSKYYEAKRGIEKDYHDYKGYAEKYAGKTDAFTEWANKNQRTVNGASLNTRVNKIKAEESRLKKEAESEDKKKEENELNIERTIVIKVYDKLEKGDNRPIKDIFNEVEKELGIK